MDTSVRSTPPRRVLAISPKRFERNLVTYLTATEIAALLGACDTTRWVGRRDRAMLLLAVQTGLRISELIGLTIGDVVLDRGAHVHTVGKGRKDLASAGRDVHPGRRSTTLSLARVKRRSKSVAEAPPLMVRQSCR